MPSLTPSPLAAQKLDELQEHSWQYFERYCNPENGLVADTSRAGSPCSTATVGFALSSYPVAIERGWMRRGEATKRVLATLRFFTGSEQSTRADATGHRGLYYHFLDMQSGRRVWRCELSTIDSALLFLGMLLCAEYFDRDTAAEIELRELAELLVSRADWRWACNGTDRIALAWQPEYNRHRDGFQKAHWSGYNEALLLILLALGAPEHSLPTTAYDAWCETYSWKTIYGHEYLYAGPFFIHQFPHLWIDFRNIRDKCMAEHSSDYFENSRRATLIQQEYSRRNPRGFAGYNQHCWGITAGDGPGVATRIIDGRKVRFYPYRARGVPFGPDDGTLAPWAVTASLPFAPEAVLPSLEYIEKIYPEMVNHFGYRCSFNPTFRTGEGYWIAPDHFGLDQGPVVLAIENYLSGLPWQLMRKSSILQRGLQKAGFSGGWLSESRQR